MRCQFVHVCCCVLQPSLRWFEVEGVDMLLFNDEGKISTIVQFDMQVGGAGFML